MSSDGQRIPQIAQITKVQIVQQLARDFRKSPNYRLVQSSAVPGKVANQIPPPPCNISPTGLSTRTPLFYAYLSLRGTSHRSLVLLALVQVSTAGAEVINSHRNPFSDYDLASEEVPRPQLRTSYQSGGGVYRLSDQRDGHQVSNPSAPSGHSHCVQSADEDVDLTILHCDYDENGHLFSGEGTSQ